MEMGICPVDAVSSRSEEDPEPCHIDDSLTLDLGPVEGEEIDYSEYGCVKTAASGQ